MPIAEKTLTATYKGRPIDLDAIRASEDWSDQGSPQARGGLPAKQGMWAFSMQPLHGCCDHSFELVVFVHIDASGTVERIATGVYRSYSPSALEEIRTSFFDHDLRRAIEALDAVDESCKDSITEHWKYQRRRGQEAWELFLDPGTVSLDSAMNWRAEVWPDE
jgi:hypothetical protein